MRSFFYDKHFRLDNYVEDPDSLKSLNPDPAFQGNPDPGF